MCVSQVDVPFTNLSRLSVLHRSSNKVILLLFFLFVPFLFFFFFFYLLAVLLSFSLPLLFLLFRNIRLLLHFIRVCLLAAFTVVVATVFLSPFFFRFKASFYSSFIFGLCDTMFVLPSLSCPIHKLFSRFCLFFFSYFLFLVLPVSLSLSLSYNHQRLSFYDRSTSFCSYIYTERIFPILNTYVCPSFTEVDHLLLFFFFFIFLLVLSPPPPLTIMSLTVFMYSATIQIRPKDYLGKYGKSLLFCKF